MIAIATIGDGTAFGALVGLAGIAFGVLQRNGAKREEESAKRTRELEAIVAELQDEKAELSHRVGNLEASVAALTERNDSMRRALGRRAEENNGG